MELTEEQLDGLGCDFHPVDGDTCPCWPCMARRDLKEARRLMQLLISADEKGVVMSSDGFGTYNVTRAMKEWIAPMNEVSPP